MKSNAFLFQYLLTPQFFHVGPFPSLIAKSTVYYVPGGASLQEELGARNAVQ